MYRATCRIPSSTASSATREAAAGTTCMVSVVPGLISRGTFRTSGSFRAARLAVNAATPYDNGLRKISSEDGSRTNCTLT